jgi:hypothetical protein
VYLGPGSSSVSPDALEAKTAAPIDVANARAAWTWSDSVDPRTRVIAVTETNTILVSSRFLDDATLTALTGTLIEYFDSYPG